MRQLSSVALWGAIVVAGAACDRRESGSSSPSTVGSSAAGSAAGSSASAATGAGSAAGSGSGAADPWSVAPTPPKPPDTPETRQQRAEAALARVATIFPAVAKLRALSAKREVPRKYQTAAEFQAFVHREIVKELPAAKSRDLSTAYTHLGLFAKPVDVGQVMEQAATTQAGAYYDPAAKSFFLVMVPDNELMLDAMSAHELTHALQDQHFALDRYLPTGKLDDDAALARRFVVEGDATFVMLLYTVQRTVGDQLSKAAVAAMRGQVDAMAAMDLDALKAQTKAQSAMLGSMGPDIQKSIDAMDELPPAVLGPMFASYMKGARLAFAAYEHAGWPGVDALFTEPPVSTEQVLHPETKLYPAREAPRRVTLPRSGDKELVGNVVGELMWRTYFELWKASKPEDAAAGWGGDRYSVSRRADGRLIARIATVWDTPEDAAQFAAAYLASLPARFPGQAARPDGIARPDGGAIFVRTQGARVFIVDGADDATAVDALARGARFE